MRNLIILIIVLVALVGCQNVGDIVAPKEDITQKFVNDSVPAAPVAEPVATEPVKENVTVAEPVVPTMTPEQSLDESVKELDMLDRI